MSITPRVLAGPGAVPRLLLDRVSCRLRAPIPAEAEHTAAQRERPAMSKRRKDGGKEVPWTPAEVESLAMPLGGVSRATLCGCLSL